MPPRSPENKSRPEKEQPVNMNNFHLYLPDGYYRGREDARTNKKQAEIMDAIDRLLATDFSHLDVQKIHKTIKEAGDLTMEAVNSGRYESTKELQKAVEPALEAAHQAREELRPLFDRLVGMGFNPKLLAQ